MRQYHSQRTEGLDSKTRGGARDAGKRDRELGASRWPAFPGQVRAEATEQSSLGVAPTPFLPLLLSASRKEHRLDHFFLWKSFCFWLDPGSSERS